VEAGQERKRITGGEREGKGKREREREGGRRGRRGEERSNFET